jgi:hypothetical protein
MASDSFHWQHALSLSFRDGHAPQTAACCFPAIWDRWRLEASSESVLQLCEDTVSITRGDTRGIRIAGIALYATRYQFHDICNFDMYHDSPSKPSCRFGNLF